MKKRKEILALSPWLVELSRVKSIPAGWFRLVFLADASRTLGNGANAVISDH